MNRYTVTMGGAFIDPKDVTTIEAKASVWDSTRGVFMLTDGQNPVAFFQLRDVVKVIVEPIEDPPA